MQSFDNDLLILESANVAIGYRLLDLITKCEGVTILEAAIAGGGRFVILATGDRDGVQSARHCTHEGLEAASRAALIDREIIAKPGQTFLEAIYSLRATKLEAALLVLDFQTVSGLLSSAHVANTAHGVIPLETRILRGSRPGGYAFLTGTEEACVLAAQDIRTRMKNLVREGNVEVVTNPNEKFRAFFEPSGKV